MRAGGSLVMNRTTKAGPARTAEADRLDAGLAALGLDDTPPGARAALLAYLSLLSQWGRTFNLTAIRDPLRMVSHHLLDSLAVLPALDDALRGRATARVLDMGSGAGLPGLPLAALRAYVCFTLIDSVGKKAGFMRQAAGEMGLANVEVRHGRVEDETEVFDVVMARAFAPLPRLVTLAGPRLVPGGCILALKGDLPDEEHVAGMDVALVDVPFVEGRRQIVRVDIGPQNG